MKSENQSGPDFAEPQKVIPQPLQEITPLQDSSDAPLEKDNDFALNQPQPEGFSLRIGPIPDPDSLREYNSVVPGFAQEFLASFLEESKHRRSMELASAKHNRDVDIKTLELEEQSLRLQDKLITGNQQRSNLGLLAGFVIVILFLGMGAAFAYKGKSIEGTILAGLGLGLPTLAGVFVGPSKKESKQDREEKKDQASEASSDEE